MWEYGDRAWASITVGIAAGGVAGQGSPGRDNEHKGLAGWNFAGFDWYFVLGIILGYDFIVDKFGLYVAPLVMIGSNSIIPGIGVGISLFRRIGLGVILPFWMLGIIIPTIFATVASAAIGVALLIGIILVILYFARRARNRFD